MNALVNYKVIFLESSRGHKTHVNSLDSIGNSKTVVGALVCHPAFKTEAFISATCHISKLFEVQWSWGCGDIPLEKRTNILYLVLPSIKKEQSLPYATFDNTPLNLWWIAMEDWQRGVNQSSPVNQSYGLVVSIVLIRRYLEELMSKLNKRIKMES